LVAILSSFLVCAQTTELPVKVLPIVGLFANSNLDDSDELLAISWMSLKINLDYRFLKNHVSSKNA